MQITYRWNFPLSVCGSQSTADYSVSEVVGGWVGAEVASLIFSPSLCQQPRWLRGATEQFRCRSSPPAFSDAASEDGG